MPNRPGKPGKFRENFERPRNVEGPSDFDGWAQCELEIGGKMKSNPKMLSSTRALDEQQQQSLCEIEQLSRKKRAALEGHLETKVSDSSEEFHRTVEETQNFDCFPELWQIFVPQMRISDHTDPGKKISPPVAILNNFVGFKVLIEPGEFWGMFFTKRIESRVPKH
uniref:Uncharacterized protein n=1 Tax=Romanomermis culicivorax TaxID=13658 RepID=A0A915HMN2_ROMCU